MPLAAMRVMPAPSVEGCEDTCVHGRPVSGAHSHQLMTVRQDSGYRGAV